MTELDFTFERREKLIRRDSYAEGFEDGEAQGIKKQSCHYYKRENYLLLKQKRNSGLVKKKWKEYSIGLIDKLYENEKGIVIK